MNELDVKQLKEFKEACLSSEGFNDACEQLQKAVKNLIEAANEVFQEEHEEEKPRPVIGNIHETPGLLVEANDVD